MKKNGLISVVFVFVFCLIDGCGTPNPFEFGSTAAPPFKIVSSSSNNNIFFSIHGFNTETSAPFFRGYNIYYAEINSTAEIQKRMLFKESGPPTIKADPSSVVTIIPASFDVFDYTNFEIPNKPPNESIDVFKNYYFIFRSYSEGDNLQSIFDSHFFEIVKESTERNFFSTNHPISTSFAFSNCQFTFTSTSLVPGGTTLFQDMGFQDNWTNVKFAPTSGYMNVPLPLAPFHTYVFEASGHHGKVYVLATNATGVTFNFSYQAILDELEI